MGSILPGAGLSVQPLLLPEATAPAPGVDVGVGVDVGAEAGAGAAAAPNAEKCLAKNTASPVNGS